MPVPKQTARPTPPPVPAPTPNRPIHSIRHRSLKASVWENGTPEKPMYDVTLTRSFKDGEEWRDSHSFGYDDLMNAAKLLYDAHSFITAKRAADHARNLPKVQQTGSASKP